MTQSNNEDFKTKVRELYDKLKSENKTGFFETLTDANEPVAGQSSVYWKDYITAILESTLKSRYNVVFVTYSTLLNDDGIQIDSNVSFVPDSSGSLVLPQLDREKEEELRNEAIRKADATGDTVDNTYKDLRQDFQDNLAKLENLVKELENPDNILSNLEKRYNSTHTTNRINEGDYKMVGNQIVKKDDGSIKDTFINWANNNRNGKLPTRLNRLKAVKSLNNKINMLQTLLIPPNDTNYENYFLLNLIIDDNTIDNCINKLKIIQKGGGNSMIEKIRGWVVLNSRLQKYEKKETIQLDVLQNLTGQIPTIADTTTLLSPPPPYQGGTWNIYVTSGDNNNCLIHSFLMATSPLFRRLETNNRQVIARLFRSKYFAITILDSLNDQAIINAAGALKDGETIKTQKENIRKRLNSKEFLTDVELTILANYFNMHIIVLCPSGIVGQKNTKLQVFGEPNNSDDTIFIQNQDGNTHFQGVSIKKEDGNDIFVLNESYK